MDLDNEYNEEIGGGSNKVGSGEEYIDSMGVKRSEYIKESASTGTYQDLLGVDDDTNAIDNLLGTGGTSKKEEAKSGNLLDIDDNIPKQSNGGSSLLDIDGFGSSGSSTYIKVPF